MKSIASAALGFTLLSQATGAPGTGVVRTADITVRGLKASDFPRTKMLAEGVYSYEQIDPPKRTVTVNNLIVITAEGVVVVEGQGTVDNTRRLLSDISRLTAAPVRYVVIGSEHGAHIGGVTAFPPSATFIVHPKSKAELERRLGRAAETVADKRVLTLGGLEIDILFLGRAHTGGDLEVYLPRERILFTSEVFVNHIFPSMANGYPTEWLATLKKAEQLDPAWYVPAHGFVDDAGTLKEEERAFRSALERIVAEGRRLHDAGTDLDSASAAARFEPYDAWTRAANNAYGALKRVYMELDGKLPDVRD
ncbi:MAG TPA: MBL fold metallo-hydrolase [Vicinamibacterales bacterium]|nr:MBL fold metallo-hydrolase [Vicinamibacterales bacterium]